MALTVTEVRDGVFRAHSSDLVNWYLVLDGDGVLLIDAGYPGDAHAVLHSIERIGRSGSDVAAILITHAHADHLGGITEVQARHHTPAYSGRSDAVRVQAAALDQVRPATVLANAWRPGVAGWAVRALRAGGTRSVAAHRVDPFPTLGVRELPGAPVLVPTPGHTEGHTAVHLPDRGVLFTGDALITGHPTSPREGPQMLRSFFHHDETEARAALTVLGSVDADLVLPGHGSPHHGSASTTAAAACR